MILTRKRSLMDIFLSRRLSKSLVFCEFASVNFEPCLYTIFDRKVPFFLIPSIDKWYLFHTPNLDLSIPFNCSAVNAQFFMCFLDFFTAIKEANRFFLYSYFSVYVYSVK